MPFCAACGSPVEGRFCPKCGAAVAAASSGYGGAPTGTASGLADNAAAALCYSLGLFTGILFLLIAPYNRNRTIRFHAFQSIFLHIAAIVVSIGLSMVFGILGRIVGFWWSTAMLSPLMGLAFFGIWIYMMVTAYQGKKIVLPVIGRLAEQQA